MEGRSTTPPSGSLLQARLRAASESQPPAQGVQRREELTPLQIRKAEDMLRKAATRAPDGSVITPRTPVLAPRTHVSMSEAAQSILQREAELISTQGRVSAPAPAAPRAQPPAKVDRSCDLCGKLFETGCETCAFSCCGKCFVHVAAEKAPAPGVSATSRQRHAVSVDQPMV